MQGSREQGSRRQRAEKPKDKKAAVAKAVQLLAIRERSEHQVRVRLAACGFSDEVAQQAIDYLLEERMLSNTRYGCAFARSKLAAGWGIARIRRELEVEGIELDSLPGWPEDFLSSSEEDRARELLSKTRFTAKDLRAAAFRKLISRGFSYEVAQTCASEIDKTRLT